MGISPKVWGKEGWHFIHYVALNYPDKPTQEDKDTYMTFLNTIEHILPCPICGHHFKQNMIKHPPNLKSQQDFFNWTVDMHNFVNAENGKKKLSYAQALSELTKNPNYIRNGLLFSTSATAIILVMTYLISKKRK
jgi:FAD-linked sulfhydryl oxidase